LPCSKTLAIAPAYPPAYNNLAIAHAREGKFTEAVPLFKKAIQLNPCDASFYRNLALAYRREGKKISS
jgi:Flp pilus assembly protein TadD